MAYTEETEGAANDPRCCVYNCLFLRVIVMPYHSVTEQVRRLHSSSDGTKRVKVVPGSQTLSPYMTENFSKVSIQSQFKAETIDQLICI